MSATIKDIAKKLGITHSTVSRALNGKPGVSDKLRQQIMELADKMGYTPNAIARGLVMKQSKTIAFIVPDFANPFYVEIAHAVNSTASERGFNTIMCDTRWDREEELQQVRLMKEKRVDGIIIKSFGKNDSHLISLGIPVVKLNESDSPNISAIDIDNVYGAYSAIEHLIKCGYKSIAYVGSVQDTQTTTGRLKGFETCMQAHQQHIDERLIVLGDYSVESGAQAYQKLRAIGIPFDAVFCENDMIALGVYDRALKDNRHIPEDLGLIGFDDMFFAGLPMTSLTTVAQPKQKIGKLAATLLLDLITKPELTKNKSITLLPELIVRSTTRPAQK